MLTITTQEAESSIFRYLAAVENGEEVLISRDKIPVAKLVPVEHSRCAHPPSAVSELKSCMLTLAGGTKLREESA